VVHFEIAQVQRYIDSMETQLALIGLLLLCFVVALFAIKA
jgi:hypothetical protein